MPAHATRVSRRHLTAPLALLVLLATSPCARPQDLVQTTPSQNPNQPQYTLRARVPLTILDVVVTDAHGHPVHGLMQSDFTILEDNKEMSPNSFEEHRSGEAAPPATPLDLPPNTFTNITPTPPKAAPLNFLLIDNLNTPTQVQQIVQHEMLAFVNKMPPGTRVAVLGLNYRIFILQGLTSDPELLKAAITNRKNISLTPPLEDTPQDAANDAPGSAADNLKVTCDVQLEHEAARGQYSIAAMKEIARFLGGMPGRKNLIWSAGSFPLQDGPCADGDTYDLTADMQSATDLLARAHVAVYPVDPRALDQVALGDQAVMQRLIGEHLTMESIAEPTGGTATYNSNDLAGAAVDAVDTGSNFYAITYTPTNQALDTRFRTINVKVDQPGLHLAYRNGYYASTPTVSLSGAKVPTVTPMQSALMRGGLDATQILFKMRVAQSPGTELTLPANNQPGPKQMHPPYRHYSLAFLIDVNGIQFSPGIDGNYRGDFEFGARVYNSDGDQIVNAVSKTVSPILPPAVYQSMLRGGANAHLEIDVPATGDYFLRIAVHDLSSDRVGSIEVPTASIAPETPPAVATEK